MNWNKSFVYKGKNLYYNRIRYNNPTERGVEVSIAFNFLLTAPNLSKILEVGNVLSFYENILSDHLGIRSRRIIDKFENDLGVDQVDLMDLPFAEKYDVIVSVSTVEHIGQGVEPSGAYGESISTRDLEAPLKAICKIYDLLALNGKALITVPFGKLIDGEWYIQFSQKYLELLFKKYGIPEFAISTTFLKKVGMDTNGYTLNQEWEEVDIRELKQTEYNWPFPCANAVAIIELNKTIENYELILKTEPTPLYYYQPLVLQPSLPSNFEENQKDDDPVQKTSPQTTIVIDGVFFQLYKTGIARVWQSLLEEWTKGDFAQHIVVVDRVGTAPKIEGIRYRTIPAYDYVNTDFDRKMLQQICDEEKANLFISTYYTTPISTPSVFIAYDMIPEILGANLDEPMWREKHRGISHASAYISISESTANDLIKSFPDIEKVTVAHCGISNTFYPASEEEVIQFKTKYGINKPYFILVGAGSDYKNAVLFFQGFAQLYSKSGFDVICTGAGYLLGTEYRELAAGSIVHSLYLSDEELRAAYSGATALVYPSKYEGFGMPIAEALACGCPVITCANASIPEVAGEAAIYIKDDHIDAMTDALCEVQKIKVRNSLITQGLEQAKKFSWSKMADTISSALINATLINFNLREINLVVFPDWNQPEELLYPELVSLIKSLATHPNRSKMTLLIDHQNLSDEDANLALSSIIMNLLIEEDVELDDTVEISLVSGISDLQWSALFKQLQGRIALENENIDFISVVEATRLPAYQVPDLVGFTINSESHS